MRDARAAQSMAQASACHLPSPDLASSPVRGPPPELRELPCERVCGSAETSVAFSRLTVSPHALPRSLPRSRSARAPSSPAGPGRGCVPLAPRAVLQQFPLHFSSPHAAARTTAAQPPRPATSAGAPHGWRARAACAEPSASMQREQRMGRALMSPTAQACCASSPAPSCRTSRPGTAACVPPAPHPSRRPPGLPEHVHSAPTPWPLRARRATRQHRRGCPCARCRLSAAGGACCLLKTTPPNNARRPAQAHSSSLGVMLLDAA